MRIPVNYSKYRYDIKGSRIGAIHIALRRGEAPRHHVFLCHRHLFDQYAPADAIELHRWSQYVKRTYPEHNHDNPVPSS